ncbi:MAG TPA: FecR domain-containing protein [Sphingomonas sp.]|nr:FecR domain-containing protein [Sphingomonas sp.]
MNGPHVTDQAALWMARSRDPHFSDWDALTDWLEADPAHNRAYEAAFAGHELAGELKPLAVVPTEVVTRRHWRWYATGGAGAAAAAAAAWFALMIPAAAPAPMIAETNFGERRLVAMADGTRIALNGGSRLVLSASDPRTARLERGEAMFNVVHDDNRPFTVDVAGERLVDLGTRFNVIRRTRDSEIAVAEGAVLYDPQGAAVRLGPGRQLRKQDQSRLVEVSDVDPAAVGTWAAGRLVYRGAPLSRVAEDLGRLTGERMEIGPDLARRAFTGVIVVPGTGRRRFFQRLGLVLDVDIASRPSGYYMKARAGR